jgi:hypothetical protein
MPRKDHIVRYSTEELQAMRAAGLDQTNWEAVLAMTDDEIEANIAADPDAGEIDESRLEEATVQTPIRFEWQVWQWLKAQEGDVHAIVNAALKTAMAATAAKTP